MKIYKNAKIAGDKQNIETKAFWWEISQISQLHPEKDENLPDRLAVFAKIYYNVPVP